MKKLILTILLLISFVLFSRAQLDLRFDSPGGYKVSFSTTIYSDVVYTVPRFVYYEENQELYAGIDLLVFKSDVIRFYSYSANLEDIYLIKRLGWVIGRHGILTDEVIYKLFTVQELAILNANGLLGSYSSTREANITIFYLTYGFGIEWPFLESFSIKISAGGTYVPVIFYTRSDDTYRYDEKFSPYFNIGIDFKPN
ncbi:MAG: hypothetical protein IIA45_08990 [Bacteroidetes bacterium]|nr:hypothetical protein [Bacteroidota bacterium]